MFPCWRDRRLPWWAPGLCGRKTRILQKLWDIGQLNRGLFWFPAELPEFLWGIALNNEKPWFEARRDVYERCLRGPMKSLIGEVLQRLEDEYPKIPLMPHLSRIYRDARTLNGRGPLNDHMWFSLGRTGRVYAAEPQFYFGIEARQCDWGLGFWNADASVMERWRASIDADPKKLARIARTVEKMDGMELWKEVYKRPKGDPGPLLYPWYNAKTLVVQRIEWFDPDPPGPELAERVAEDFSRLMPLYQYFLKL